MNFKLIGCSHHRSDASVREKLAFTDNQVGSFLERFYDRFPKSEAVLLSTCNRTELYAAGKQSDLIPSREELIGILAEHQGLHVNQIEPGLFSHSNEQAVFHLFSVAASLDSLVVGETQILAQVKQAYQIAVSSNPDITLSHRIFQNAIRVARRVANETDLQANRVSIPSIAIGMLAKRIFERLDNKRVLVIGAGKMAHETLTYLKYHGAKQIYLINRTPEKAESLAEQHGGQAVPWHDLEHQLSQSDLIVSATAATQPVIELELFDRVEKIRQQRPLFILDLAIPRDVAEEVGDRLNVYLYTIDDLRQECDRNRKSRESHWPAAEKILRAETKLFMQEMQRRGGGAVIAQLKQNADTIKASELTRLNNRLDGLSDADREEIEYAFNRLVNKILHPPLESLKDESQQGTSGLLEALKKLFKLTD